MAQAIPYHVDINRVIEILATQIYQSPLALLRENCQNAYDAILMRQHLGQKFDPQIDVSITGSEVQVSDNGIGMTSDDLEVHYWRAGASGKNNPEARAAGVVGTFGIGAMANFGVADRLVVTTESAKTHERTISAADRATLSASEPCITRDPQPSLGEPGTKIVATLQNQGLSVDKAEEYITQSVKYLPIKVYVNEKLVSKNDISQAVPRPGGAKEVFHGLLSLDSGFEVNMTLIFGSNGEPWLELTNIKHKGQPINGQVMLAQDRRQIQAYRSWFALATTAISSEFGLGGIANLASLNPTAGRESLTSDSIQFLQSLITALERYIAEQLGQSVASDVNTRFMAWVAAHNRFDLCSHITVPPQPNNINTPLHQINERSQHEPLNLYIGNDQSIIGANSTEDQPLITVSERQPRRKCQLGFLEKYVKHNKISNKPVISSLRSRESWSLGEAALAFRLVNILDTDYFVKSEVQFGDISYGVPILVETTENFAIITFAANGSIIAPLLQLYESEFSALTPMIKDLARSVIFPKIKDLVPSSTKKGAEAFLKSIRKPKDLFEYEKVDLGHLSEIWASYIDGSITLADAADRSVNIVRSSVQTFEPAAIFPAATVISDVLENEALIEPNEEDVDDKFDAAPAITRLDTSSEAKLLTIDESDNALKGYRCFVAISQRVRSEYGEFFLQPHRTEIVWGGQKALFIFQHHSGEFGLYYELQSTEVLADVSGGGGFQTCTVVLNNQVYIPVPSELQSKFIPHDQEKKQFEGRCDLLYPG